MQMGIRMDDRMAGDRERMIEAFDRFVRMATFILSHL